MAEIKRLQEISKKTGNGEKNENAGKSRSKQLPEPVKFDLPKFELNLEFFLKKGNEPFTPESLIQAVFGDKGTQFTPAEQLYVILKAMEDLEVIAPLKFECPHCEKEFTAAVNLPKAMKTRGESFQEFHLQEGKYVFKFTRPQQIGDVSGIESLVASSGMFMLQWLEAHNQGEDFDILKMPLPEFLKIVTKFGEFMFGVSFDVMLECGHCRKKSPQEFEVSIADLANIINEI